MPVDVEFGYRWLRLSGNSDMYRTQINERSGLLIRSMSIAGTDTPFTDFFRVDASDLGVGPAGNLRVEFGKSSTYRFLFHYRQTNAFSALPAFANPFLAAGIIPGQHTYDRDRRMIDADFEWQKWSRITPFVGVSWNRYSGPGTTTYHAGGDEFALLSSLADRSQEIRGGFGFTYGNFYGQLTQGWRTFRQHETLTLAPTAGAGNELTPILGHDITASSLTRNDRSSGHTPFTNLYVAGQLTSRARLIADYVRFAAREDASESENAAGSFVDFGISRFFAGLNDQIDSNAKNTTWRGGLRAEVGLTDRVDLFASARREHRALEGSALINDLFLQSVNFGGLDPRDVRTVIDAKSALDRNEDVLHAAVSARSLGPFSLRAGVSESRQDVTVSPDLSEIVVPGASQGGVFKRRVHTYDAGGTFAKAGFTAGASWWHDNADHPILRTDFLSRDRFRLRGGWHTASDRFSAGVTTEESRPKNSDAGIDYHATIRQTVANADFAPIEKLRLRASASRFRTTSSILYRRPETFAVDTSAYEENGKGYEGGALVTFAPVSFDASLAHFENDGSNPFDLNRYAVRAMLQPIGHVGVTVEWNHDRYKEPVPAFGNFDADRYGVYLRWAQ